VIIQERTGKRPNTISEQCRVWWGYNAACINLDELASNEGGVGGRVARATRGEAGRAVRHRRGFAALW
jgi:hypothetical protein